MSSRRLLDTSLGFPPIRTIDPDTMSRVKRSGGRDRMEQALGWAAGISMAGLFVGAIVWLSYRYDRDNDPDPQDDQPGWRRAKW